MKDYPQVQKEHFRDRAKERFKIKIDKQMRSSIIKAIERGRTILIDKRNDHRELHSMQVGRFIVYVVYDTITRQPVTIMYSGKTVRPYLKRGLYSKQMKNQS